MNLKKVINFFCNVYVYPYANEDNIEIPKPFENI